MAEDDPVELERHVAAQRAEAEAMRKSLKALADERLGPLAPPPPGGSLARVRMGRAVLVGVGFVALLIGALAWLAL